MKKLQTFTLALLLVGGASVAANGQEPASKSSSEVAAARYFGDTELVNQDGKTVRFYSDLLKDKVVVINCFFATCNGACLPLTRNLAKIQELMGDHIGKDLFLISITVDPTMDTPARLKQFAISFKARPGWTFLTGTKTNVDLVQKKLGQYVDDKTSHNNIFLIGNLRTGLWKKAFGLAKPEELVPIVESVLNDKGAP